MLGPATIFTFLLSHAWTTLKTNFKNLPWLPISVSGLLFYKGCLSKIDTEKDYEVV